MKILQVVSFFHPAYSFGGPVNTAYHISKELVKRGHEVVVYTTDAKDWDSRLNVEPVKVVDGIKVHYMRNLSMIPVKKSNLFITPKINLRSKEEIKEFDIVHLHEFRTFQNIIIHHYAKKYGVPYVLQARGSLPRMMAKQRLKLIYDIFFGYRLLRDATKVVALSRVEVEQYREMGVPAEKIEVIPNGIDLSEYVNLPPKGRFKESHNVEKVEKVVLYLGRIHRLKGIDFLIDAFAYLIKNIKYDNAILVIAGPDDGYLDKSKELIKQRRIEDRVLFTGPLFGIRKLEAYVDASIVASLDSLREIVFLLVPLEAAACGTPVIVTKSNYIATLVQKGKFGSSIEYGNIPKLANMFEEMLNNEDLLSEMGLNGRKFVFENCDWANIITKLEKVYEDTLSGTSEDCLKAQRCGARY